MNSDRYLQHPLITHILRTGEPPQQKYPERDNVEVVEVDKKEYEEIIQRRNERKGTYEIRTRSEN